MESRWRTSSDCLRCSSRTSILSRILHLRHLPQREVELPRQPRGNTHASRVNSALLFIPWKKYGDREYPGAFLDSHTILPRHCSPKTGIVAAMEESKLVRMRATTGIHARRSGIAWNVPAWDEWHRVRGRGQPPAARVGRQAWLRTRLLPSLRSRAATSRPRRLANWAANSTMAACCTRSAGL